MSVRRDSPTARAASDWAMQRLEEDRLMAIRESTVDQKLHLLKQIFGPPPVELCLTETICQAGIEVSE